MILKFKELIYCIFNSHNEVLMRILGLTNFQLPKNLLNQ